jgi:pantetheine-phosphate adenylyltransferase
MNIAVCPGSFDPVTYGHLDIIRRAAALFGEVIILVVTNPDKRCVFTAEERCDMIRRVVEDLPNVKVDSYGGLLADYCREHGAAAIVKGLRAVSDFEYEFQMALANKKLLPEADTLFLTTNAENMYLSSSLVRQIASLGGDISPFIPEEIREEIRARLQGKPTQEE